MKSIKCSCISEPAKRGGKGYFKWSLEIKVGQDINFKMISLQARCKAIHEGETPKTQNNTRWKATVKTHISVTRYSNGSHYSITAEFHSLHPPGFLSRFGFPKVEEQEISQQGARPKHHLDWPWALLLSPISVPPAGIVDKMKIDIFAFLC